LSCEHPRPSVALRILSLKHFLYLDLLLSRSGFGLNEQTLNECFFIFSLTWGGTWSPAGRPSQVLRWWSTRGSTSRASNPAHSTSRHQAAHITSAETARRERCNLSVPVCILPRHVTCLLPGFFWPADESPPVISEQFTDDQSRFRVISRGLLLTQWSLFCTLNRLSWQEEDS